MLLCFLQVKNDFTGTSRAQFLSVGLSIQNQIASYSVSEWAHCPKAIRLMIAQEMSTSFKRFSFWMSISADKLLFIDIGFIFGSVLSKLKAYRRTNHLSFIS